MSDDKKETGVSKYFEGIKNYWKKEPEKAPPTYMESFTAYMQAQAESVQGLGQGVVQGIQGAAQNVVQGAIDVKDRVMGTESLEQQAAHTQLDVADMIVEIHKQTMIFDEQVRHILRKKDGPDKERELESVKASLISMEEQFKTATSSWGHFQDRWMEGVDPEEEVAFKEIGRVLDDIADRTLRVSDAAVGHFNKPQPAHKGVDAQAGRALVKLQAQNRYTVREALMNGLTALKDAIVAQIAKLPAVPDMGIKSGIEGGVSKLKDRFGLGDKPEDDNDAGMK